MATSGRKDVRKEVRYLNKDFASFRQSLMDFSKVYFPNTYNDFNESSPGMMFIEMASYVGDVLSYYIDSQFKEMMLGYAEERKNVMKLAQSFGYKPKVSVGASTNIDVFQIVPSIGSGDDWKPDLRYGLVVKDGMLIAPKEKNNITFRTVEDCNFKISSSYDPMEVSIYEYNPSTNEPQRYLLKKQIQAIAGEIKTETFSFNDPEKYAKVRLSRDDVIEVLEVKDTNLKTWYEVPYLAQDTVFIDTENNALSDPELAQYSDSAPYLLKLRKTPRRFITRITDDNKTELQFGAGVSTNPDEVIIPNPANIANETLGTPVNLLNGSFDPSNFLRTKTYGQVPQNTTLTVTYSHGGGVNTNIQSSELTEILSMETEIDSEGLDSGHIDTAKSSVACINPDPATGGRSEESLDEIRNNALAYFASQNRCVTGDDYVVRSYSMPPKYGSISKAYVVQDEQLNQSGYSKSTLAEDKNDIDNQRRAANMAKAGGGRTNKLPGNIIPNPFALNLYTLGYDGTKKLTTLSPAVKENLKLYLGQYRILTDAVNIKNAWIINIGVDFEIVTIRGYNKREVLLKCVNTIREFFDIDKWQINQPVSIADLIYEIGLVEGVQTVIDVDINNLWDENLGYSGNVYDIDEAIRNKVLYPSMDPSIFEVKFPNQDIRGKVQEG